MIPKYSLVADVGCGNGKYTSYRQDIFVIANDICIPLLHMIKKSNDHGCCIADGLYLPYKTKSFQYAISIAVLHHISDYSRQNLLNLEKIVVLASSFALLIPCCKLRCCLLIWFVNCKFLFCILL